MRTSTVSNLCGFMPTDFGIMWIAGKPETRIYCYPTEVESEFKQYVKDIFHTTISRTWTDNYMTVEVKGKTLNATRRSFLLDNPEKALKLFPELVDLTTIPSYTEEALAKVNKPAVVVEDRTLGWSDALNCGTEQLARKDFKHIVNQLEDNDAFTTKVFDSVAYAYSKQKPYFAIYKVVLAL